MVLRKSVRFSGEDTFSDTSSPIPDSTSSKSGRKSPSRPILVKREDSSSPASTTDSLQDSGRGTLTPQEVDLHDDNDINSVFTKQLEDRQKTRTAGNDSNQTLLNTKPASVAKENEGGTHLNIAPASAATIKQSSHKEQSAVQQPVSNAAPQNANKLAPCHTRPYSAPASSSSKHWDTKSKQFFKVQKGRDTIRSPVEVRVYELNCPFAIGRPKLWYPCQGRKSDLQTNVTKQHASQSIERKLSPSRKNTSTSDVQSSIKAVITELGDIDPLGDSLLIGSQSELHAANFHRKDIHSTSAPASDLTPGIDNCIARSKSPYSQTCMSVINSTSENLRPGDTMSNLVISPGIMSRTDAKLELQNVGNRLGNYIQYVREISENANQVDLAQFIDSFKSLEGELVNMKNLYEQELTRARLEVDELGRDKHQYWQEAVKYKMLAAELENRLTVESDKNRKNSDDIIKLQQSVVQKDQQVQEVRIGMQKPISELDGLSKDYQAMLRDNDTLKRRYDKEQLQRQDAEDKTHHLHQKIEFDSELHDQQTTELSERLQSACSTILTLEAKIREMSHADTALAEMLQRVRSVAEEEIERYRQESEARFNQNIAEMQAQLNNSHRKCDDLTERNHSQHKELASITSQMRQLQGQVSSLQHQKQCLEDQINMERARSHEHIRNLEQKLVELQEMVVSKMREVNTARDAQIPLKAEIETLRTMLSEEEQRLQLPPSPRLTDIPPPGLPPLQGQAANGLAPRQVGTSQPVTTGYSTGTAFNTYSIANANTGTGASRYTEGSPRAIGPVRIRSAPATSNRSHGNAVPVSLGQGRDYFEEMFKDLRLSGSPSSGEEAAAQPHPPAAKMLPQYDRPSNPEPISVSTSYQSNDCLTTTSSSTGDIKILEVQGEGRYIRLVNLSQNKDEELGGYLLQQNIGGHPVAVFRFPPRVRLAANTTVTVWAGCNNPSIHDPPSDFYFKEQHKWGTGPECTSILCKASGQAIAWTTSAKRIGADACLDTASHNTSTLQNPAATNAQTEEDADNESSPLQGEELTEYNMNINAQKPDAVYLCREKASPPSLNAPKHPHGVNPPCQVHPHTSQARPMTYGNDNSSVNRQSRVQSTRPDPVPGAPYAGASAQRMGSSMLRRYQPPTVRGSGALANKAAGSIRMMP